MMKDITHYLSFFKLDVEDIQDVPESFSSEVYCLQLKNGEKVILKIPYSEVKYEREVFFLERLAGKLPVPQLIQRFETDGTHPSALLLSYIDGHPIEGEVDEDLAYQLGALLAKLHTIPMAEYNVVPNEVGWWEGIHAMFNSWLLECKDVLTPVELDACQSVFAKFYENLPTPDGPCVVHMDYRPGNILVRDNKIQGLIDFESSRGGSADADFTKVKLYVWDKYPGTKEAFIKGYQSIRSLPDIENTLPFYQFYNALGGVAWSIRRNQLSEPFFQENMEQLKLYITK